MKDTKPFYKKIWFWVFIIAGLVLAIFGPVVINELYIKNEGYITVWRGEDVLAYYGSLLGASATIIALVATICFTINNQKKERKLSVRPYLQRNLQLLDKYEDKLFENVAIFIKCSDNLLETYSNLPDDMKDIKILQERLRGNKDVSGSISLLITIGDVNKKVFGDNCVLIYELENYGSNTALDIELGFNDLTLPWKFCIRANEKKKLVLIVDGRVTQANISFEYFDVYSLGKYRQKEALSISKDDEGWLCIIDKDNMLTSPEEITEE